MSRRRAVAAAAAAAALAGTTALSAAAAAAPSHVATAPSVVKVKVTKKAITFTGGTHLSAGRFVFDVSAPKGDHTLQLLRLHKGYSAKQLHRDIEKGIDRGNNVHAIRRLDRRVTWLGGAEANRHKNGEFAVVLKAGKYFAVDQDGPAAARLNVSGATQPGGSVAPQATVVGTSKDRWHTPKRLPHNGWIRLKDTSSEAHFLVVQQVKKSTTNHKVHKYVRHAVKTGDQSNPPWLLRAGTSSGVFSRHTDVDFHLALPKGKYLIACFWNSKQNGMPHFLMGMWKLVKLR